ncbi:MAG: hypothetical protein MZV70_51460 [Desulfobacterales bacterium]|nr:hypothetical protein [Desulfobacterales bacterium]
MVYSESGHAEPDCIFTTDRSRPTDRRTPGSSASYEPPLLIEFVRVNPLRAIRYAISTASEPLHGETEADWRRSSRVSNEEGNSVGSGTWMRRLSGCPHGDELEKMLDHYLAQTGCSAMDEPSATK